MVALHNEIRCVYDPDKRDVPVRPGTRRTCRRDPANSLPVTRRSIKVAILDKDGILCPRASNMVNFSVSGAGKIQAVENGDSSCFEPIHGKQRSAFNGLCQVVVRTKKGESGTITVTATSGGLAAATAKLKVM